MKRLKNALLAGALLIGSPNVKADNDIKIKQVVVDVTQQTIDALNMELMIELDNVYKKKIDEINEYLGNYSKYTGEELIYMSEENFLELISKVYNDNNEIINFKNNPRYKDSDFDSIINAKKKTLEVYFDNIFGAMISNGESERALLYMGYLNNNYGYKFENFVKNYFSFDFLPDGLVKENVNKIIKELESKSDIKQKEEYIDNLKSEDFYESDYLLFDDYTKQIVDTYVLVIKEKMKELYFN